VVSELKPTLVEEAGRLGFDVLGVTQAAGDLRDAEHLAAYLSQGRHGEMAWMAATAARRSDPHRLWPDARSIIAVGINYGPDDDPLAGLDQPDAGWISVYARGTDYHKVVLSRLRALARWLVAVAGGEAKVFVDTAPVMEKPIAQRAGLGWIGKHTNLVSRRFGSWLFLGEIFTTLAIDADPPETDHCGSCDACMRACPTGALPEPYRIDPRRCISYLTIEHKSALAPDLAHALGNRIYGCDDCLAACPWNKYAEPSRHAPLAALPDRVRPDLAQLTLLDDAAFRARFAGSPIKRTGRTRMLRNVAHALANAATPTADANLRRLAADGDPSLSALATRLLHDRHMPHRTTTTMPAASRGIATPRVPPV
jgi:epoxyqueuosine reductase